MAAIRSGLLSEYVPHDTLKLIRESPEPECKHIVTVAVLSAKGCMTDSRLSYAACSTKRSTQQVRALRGRGYVRWRRGRYKSEAIVWGEKLVADSAHSIN